MTTDENLTNLDAKYAEQVVGGCANTVAVATKVYDEVTTYGYGVFKYRQWYS